MWYQMKAKGITFPMSTKFKHFTVLRFSQKQKIYPYPNKKCEKRHFFLKKVLINNYFKLHWDCFYIKRVKYITLNKTNPNKPP